MKIRNRKVINLLGYLAAWGVRGLLGSVRFRQRFLGPDVCPTSPGQAGQFIYAFWHEYQLVPAFHFARPNTAVLVSQSADGQLIAEACRHLGFGLVRGSTSRGGTEALRELLRAARQGRNLAITPDGPRGPRRQLQPGAIYLAARSGLPIVPFGIGVRNAWRALGWDRFALPWPLTSATCVWGRPIEVPSSASRENLEEYRRQVELALGEVTSLAEQWAETGNYPEAEGKAGGEEERVSGAA